MPAHKKQSKKKSVPRKKKRIVGAAKKVVDDRKKRKQLKKSLKDAVRSAYTALEEPFTKQDVVDHVNETLNGVKTGKRFLTSLVERELGKLIKRGEVLIDSEGRYHKQDFPIDTTVSAKLETARWSDNRCKTSKWNVKIRSFVIHGLSTTEELLEIWLEEFVQQNETWVLETTVVVFLGLNGDIGVRMIELIFQALKAFQAVNSGSKDSSKDAHRCTKQCVFLPNSVKAAFESMIIVFAWNDWHLATKRRCIQSTWGEREKEMKSYIQDKFDKHEAFLMHINGEETVFKTPRFGHLQQMDLVMTGTILRSPADEPEEQTTRYRLSQPLPAIELEEQEPEVQEAVDAIQRKATSSVESMARVIGLMAVKNMNKFLKSSHNCAKIAVDMDIAEVVTDLD